MDDGGDRVRLRRARADRAAFSPLGQLVTRVITPRLGVPEQLVAGPPKRFAQGIGAVLSVSAAVLALGFGEDSAAYVLLGLIVVAATLESVFGFCVGCTIFAGLMRVGCHPRRGLRALQRHLGARAGTGVSAGARR